MRRKNSLKSLQAQIREGVADILLGILAMLIDRLASENKRTRAQAQRVWRTYGPQIMQDLKRRTPILRPIPRPKGGLTRG